MHIVVQKQPLMLNSGTCIEVPMSHPLPDRACAIRWIMERGLRSVAEPMPLSKFVASGGLEPGKNN
jgi:hypothetical protein